MYTFLRLSNYGIRPAVKFETNSDWEIYFFIAIHEIDAGMYLYTSICPVHQLHRVIDRRIGQMGLKLG
jgi:hypothetical protein